MTVSTTKIKIWCEADVPTPVAEQILNGNLSKVNMILPVKFVAGDSGEFEYTYTIDEELIIERSF